MKIETELNPVKWTAEERQQFLDKGFRHRREDRHQHRSRIGAIAPFGIFQAGRARGARRLGAITVTCTAKGCEPA